LRQERALRLEQFRGLDLVVRGERPDLNLIALFANVTQPADAPDIDDVLRSRQAKLHQGDQAVPAGQHLALLAELGQKLRGLSHRLRNVILKGLWNHKSPKSRNQKLEIR